MPYGPEPLAPGSTLRDRFDVQSVLGQGGFGITYLARDRERGDLCAMKELAPAGTVRKSDGTLDWAAVGPGAAERLRHAFMREGKTLRSLRIKGVPAVRESFSQNKTAYLVSEYVTGTTTLQQLLTQQGRQSGEFVEALLDDLLPILDQLHNRRILHRDIKPSNLLLGEDGHVWLIDFGSAREWHRDATLNHTVEYTPGYAPPEQLSEKGRRGPATDLYGLCATAYTLLIGVPPPPVTDRMAHDDLRPLDEVRTDLRPGLARAIHAGLALKFERRPQSADELAQLLRAPDDPDQTASLEALDAKFALLKKLRWAKLECPTCGGTLLEPKPLRANLCPVCRGAQVARRAVPMGQCPVCRTGVWRRVENQRKGPWFCPSCKTGKLRYIKPLLGPRRAKCQSCQAQFTETKTGVQLVGTDHTATWAEWIEASGRTEWFELCDACSAQFDPLPDGRLKQVSPKPKSGELSALYPDEWARVAAGLRPDQGNAQCPACDADFYIDDSTWTLLEAPEDPFGFAEQHQGRRFSADQIRWAGAGKPSGQRGPVCPDCTTEFDLQEGEWVLSATRHRELRMAIGDRHPVGNWFRLANGLPLMGHEAELEEEIERAARREFRRGEQPLDPKRPGVHLRVEASWEGKRGKLLADEEGLEFGGVLRKSRWPLAEIVGIAGDDETLLVHTADGIDEFQFAWVEWSLALSRRVTIQLTASDFAARLRHAYRLPEVARMSG